MLLTAVLAAVCALLGALEQQPAPGPGSGSDQLTYEHPVDAEITEGFRAPAAPWAPGHRGIDYATEPGDEVRAPSRGRVSFAGPVAGSLHVTIAHPDGTLTSFSFLESIAVGVGEEVSAGTPIARAAGHLHVGVRQHGGYVDPQALFGLVPVVRLVPEDPLDGPGWTGPRAEAVMLALESRLHDGDGPSFMGGVRWVFTTAYDLVVEHVYLPATVLGGWLADPFMLGTRILERTIEWIEQLGDCTPAGAEPERTGGRRIAVLVAGLASRSSSAAIGGLAVGELGYASGDVVGFSYTGGRTPGLFSPGEAPVSEDLGGIAASPYDLVDSSTSLAAKGDLLADLLVALAAASPGTPIDLFAHSQGGIVVRLALRELESRPGGPEVIASLGLVATLGSPHRGADLASVAVAASDIGVVSPLVWAADRFSDLPIDPDHSNVSDLALESELLAELSSSGLPAGPEYLSLGARGDAVVLDEQSRLPGAEHVTLPIDGLDAHSELPGHPAATRELGLALAGEPPTCESFGDLIADLVVTESLHQATALVGAGIATARLVTPDPLGLASGLLSG